MDTAHLRRHLSGLMKSLEWLRTLPPEGPRYKLWLGDLVEFVRDAFGAESAQMAQIRVLLTGDLRPLPEQADEAARTRTYLARLDAFVGLLAGFERRLRDPIVLIDFGGNGADSGGRPPGS